MVRFCAAKGYLFSLNKHHFRFEISEIPYYDSVADFREDMQKWVGDEAVSFEKCLKKEIPVVLGGGGGALFDKLYQVPLIKRSESAPSNPGKWTIATGRFETDEELLHPEAMIRELWEEILVYKDDSAVSLQAVGHSISSDENAQAYLLDNMILDYGGSEYNFSGWLSLSASGEMNTIIPVKINYDLSEYDFVDGEMGNAGKRLDRKISLHSVKKLRLFSGMGLTEHAQVAIDNVFKISTHLDGQKR